MRQHVEVTIKLTLSIDVTLHMEDIGVYVREGLYSGFEDQAEHIDGNTMVDILEIKEEADIYGNEKNNE